MPKIDQKYYAFGAILISTALWGVAGPVIKLTLQHLPVVAFLFLRFLIVCVILLPFAILELKKDSIDKKDIPNLIILGLLSQTSILVVFLGYKFTSALDASLIGITYPLMALYAGSYFYREKISPTEKLGVLIATIGTLIIILEPIFTNHTPTAKTELRMFGNILVLGYQVIWLFFMIWSRQVMGHRSAKVTQATRGLHLQPMRKKYSPTLLTTITFYVGLASLIPLVILESLGLFGPNTFSWALLNPTALAGLLYMAILSSIVAYICFQWGLNKANVEDTAYFTYLGPIFAFPAAYLLLGEVPTLALLIGFVVIACGVIVAELDKS